MRRNTIERHVVRGGLQLEKGSFRKALDEFLAVLKRDPDDARTWLRVAEIYTRLGEGLNAAEAYRTAASVHARKGFARHALALYKNVLTLVPDDLDALRNVAELSGHLGLLSDATLQYESLLKFCQLQDRTDEALGALRCILKLNPTDVRIQLHFAETALALGHRDEALEKLRSAAIALKLAGRIDEYLRVAEQILKEEPKNVALARELAKGYLVRGNGRFALARLRMCYDEEPKDAELLDLLAQAFELMGNKDKAVILLKALGQVHRDQGRRRQALDTLHRAIDMKPLDEELQEALLELEGRTYTPTEVTIDIDIMLPEPAAPQLIVTEEETLRIYMPAFITSHELQAVPSAPTDDAFDLFPVAQAQNISSEIVFLLDKTATKLRKLIALLPEQMEAKDRLSQAMCVLHPGGALLSELTTLSEELRSNDWIDDLPSIAEG